MEDIIQIKITLKGSKPPIWRRLLVEKKSTFEDLHYTIQTAMGWYNCHLFQFMVDGLMIGLRDEFTDMEFSEDEFLDSSTIALETLIKIPKQKFEYEYDFGDGWIHEIVIEKFLPRDANVQYPLCIAGKQNCPPEDCGGIYGYCTLLEALADPKHPDHQDLSEWMEDEFDPNFFDLESVNEELREFISKPQTHDE